MSKAPKKGKRVTKKKGPTTKQLERRVTKLEHQEELKYHDVYSTTSWNNNTTTTLVLSLIAQGDDFNQRIGEEITAKYLNIRMDCGAAPTTIDPLRYRIVVFWDLQANGSGPEPFAGTNANQGLLDNLTINSAMLAPLNYRTHDRYKILHDKIITINPNDPSIGTLKMYKRNLKLGGAKIKYSSSAGNISAVVGRSLCCFITAISGASDDTVSAFSARLWYTDA